jgi:hypothetical protein
MTTVRVIIEVAGMPLDYPLSVTTSGDPTALVAAALRLAAAHIETGEIRLKEEQR